MIRTILTAAVILMVLGIPCLAQAHSAMFTVPFGFQVASRQLPEGEYRLTVDGQTAVLRNLDNPEYSVCWHAPTMRQETEMISKSHLHFLLTGGQYYLHLAEAESHQAHLSVPKPIDPVIARNNPAVKTITIVAD